MQKVWVCNSLTGRERRIENHRWLSSGLTHPKWQEWALGPLWATALLTVFSVPWQELSEYNATAIKSPTNTVTVQGLKAGAIYVFQVRARTVAGYGRYSGKMYFQTMTEGEQEEGTDSTNRINLRATIPPKCLGTN